MDGAQIVEAMFDAITAQDWQGYRAMFTDDAALWHSFDQVDRPIGHVIEDLKMMQSLLMNARFDERRFLSTDDGAIAQVVNRGTTLSGKPVALYIIVRFYITEDGRIRRMEEYVDSAQAAVILEEAAAKGSDEEYGARLAAVDADTGAP